MTTIATAGRRTSAASRQFRTVTARHLREIARTVLITIGISLAVVAVAQVTAMIWGGVADGAVIFVGDEGEQMTIHLAASWAAVAAGAVAVAALVHHIVVGAQDARIEIANGTTRPILIAASLIVALVTALVIVALAALTYGVEGILGFPQEDSLIATIIDEGNLGLGMALLHVGVSALALMLFGLAVGTVFILFPWWVGVAALVFQFWIVPTVAFATGWKWLEWLTNYSLWTAILAVLGYGAAYVLMVRRMPIP